MGLRPTIDYVFRNKGLLGHTQPSWSVSADPETAQCTLLLRPTGSRSKLSLNIASAHVATFGERVVDVFYVTDLLGAKIASPTREMAIKRSLLQLFTLPA